MEKYFTYPDYFKWCVDNKIWIPFPFIRYRKAAEEYCQAARFHHLAGSEEAALNDLLLALDCFEKKRNWFPAAKTLEQVVVLTLKVRHIT